MCPAGYECLVGSETSMNGFCSRTCTPGQGTDDCAAGYTGVGLPMCIFAISGGQNYCGIVCEAQGVAELNGMCPSGMSCTIPLTDAMMMEVGKACDVI